MSRANALIAVVNKYENKIKEVVPENTIDKNRIVGMFLQQAHKNPKLYACDPVSVLGAMCKVASYGIEPEYAYLIPFKQDCNVIIDYRAERLLAMRSGQYSDIYAEVVRKNDEVVYELGGSPKVFHKVDVFNPRGDAVGYYALAVIKDGTVRPFFMSKEEVEKHRNDHSKKDRHGNFSAAWTGSFDEMAKKTVMRKLTKTLNKTTEMMQLETLDSTAELVSQQNHLLIDANHATQYSKSADATTIHEINAEEKNDSRKELFAMIEQRVAHLLGDQIMMEPELCSILNIDTIHDINDFDETQLAATWEVLQSCKTEK